MNVDDLGANNPVGSQIARSRGQLHEGAADAIGGEKRPEVPTMAAEVKRLLSRIAQLTLNNDSLGGALSKVRLLGVMAATLAGLFAATPARAQEIATYLLDINQGSGLTQIVQSLEGDSYELSDGTKVSFLKWYHTDWIDLRIDMLTQLSENFGILWGASTGEWGEKFSIEPSLKLGVIAQAKPRPNSTLSLSVSTIIGGRLTEYPCQADYGNIGGVQTVNCRLAATELAPQDTLRYLLNTEPNRLSISVSYSARF